MKSIQYIFDRPTMKDPFDNSTWKEGEIRKIEDFHHYQRLLLHTDCWAEAKEAPEIDAHVEELRLAHEVREAADREEQKRVAEEQKKAEMTPQEREQAEMDAEIEAARQSDIEDKQREAAELLKQHDEAAERAAEEGRKQQEELDRKAAEMEKENAERKAKEEKEEVDVLDEHIGNMPDLNHMTKAQLMELAQREFRQPLDANLKVNEMRDRIAAMVNGPRR